MEIIQTNSEVFYQKAKENRRRMSRECIPLFCVEVVRCNSFRNYKIVDFMA